MSFEYIKLLTLLTYFLRSRADLDRGLIFLLTESIPIRRFATYIQSNPYISDGPFKSNS